jgi:hypothetical protein
MVPVVLVVEWVFYTPSVSAWPICRLLDSGAAFFCHYEFEDSCTVKVAAMVLRAAFCR